MNKKINEILLKDLYWFLSDIVKTNKLVSELYEIGLNQFGYYFYYCENNKKVGFTFNPNVSNSDLSIYIDNIHYFISRKNIEMKTSNIEDLFKILKKDEKFKIVRLQLFNIIIQLANYSLLH